MPNSIIDPLPSMIEVLPGELVVTTEKSPPHTAGDDMKESRLFRRCNLAAWIGHAASVTGAARRGNRKIAQHQVGLLLGYLGVLDLPPPGCPRLASLPKNLEI